MGTCVQYVLFVINLILMGATSKYHQSNAAFGVETFRIRRQAGYVYDRPSISFNLPSQTTVGSTSTQATTVDRTSAQQMYYAYPAPSGGNTGNVGYSNTGSTGATSTATSGASGYNYNAATQNTATGSTDGGGTVNIGYSSSASTGDTSAGGGGYNYGGGTQNTESVSSGGSTSSASSGSEGYNYQTQNTGLQSATISGSSGYSGSSSGSSGYSGPSSGSSSVVSMNSGSTKAPEYLPPANSGGGNVGISVSTNTQSSSGSTGVAPSERYIPPVSTQQQIPSVTVTQTGSNVVPSMNVVTQTSAVSVSRPSSSYLLPNSGSQTSNAQNIQTQVTVSSPGPVTSVPEQEYLPPVVTSTGTAGQGSVFRPAAKYLPPVFK